LAATLTLALFHGSSAEEMVPLPNELVDKAKSAWANLFNVAPLVGKETLFITEHSTRIMNALRLPGHIMSSDRERSPVSVWGLEQDDGDKDFLVEHDPTTKDVALLSAGVGGVSGLGYGIASIAGSGAIVGFADGGATAGLAAIGGGAVELGVLACAGITLGGALVVGGIGWGVAHVFRQQRIRAQYELCSRGWYQGGNEMPRGWELGD
jgi:hypothetical protein